MIYVILFLIVALLAVLEFKGTFVFKKSEDHVGYLLIFMLFVFTATFRYRVGGDTLAYMSYFTNMPLLSQLAAIDYLSAEYNPLWYLFNAVVKVVWDDFIFFQFVHAALVNGVIFWFFKRNTRYKYFAVLFYFFFYFFYFNMEILRESLALSVFLLGYRNLIERKWLNYYILCLICVLIHSSALVLFVLPFLYFKFRNYYGLIALGLIPLIQFIDLFEVFSFLEFSRQISLKMNSYLNSEINVFGMILVALLVFPTLIIHYLRKNARLCDHQFENNVTAYVTVGLLAMVIGGFYRFLNYLVIINLIYIIDTLVYFMKGRNVKYKIWMNFVLIMLVTYQVYYYVRDTSEYEKDTRFYVFYHPYHSIFDPKVHNKRENLKKNWMNLTRETL